MITLVSGCLNVVFSTMAIVSGPRKIEEILLVMTVVSSICACGFSAVHSYRATSRNSIRRATMTSRRPRVYPVTAVVSIGCLVSGSAAYACRSNPWYMFASQCVAGICLTTVTVWRFVCA